MYNLITTLHYLALLSPALQQLQLHYMALQPSSMPAGCMLQEKEPLELRVPTKSLFE